MRKTWLIVGLGNPEGKYFQTWHNVGFLAADAAAARLGLEFKKKGNQMTAKCLAESAAVFLLKPLTYMNLSGQAVIAAARKNKIEPENIIVFTDDLYIDKGNIRIGMGGSAAGHNGIKSINELLGTNQYIKIRIGIKPDKPFLGGSANFVLSKIDDISRPLINEAIENAVNAALAIANGNALSKLQGLYNITNEVTK